MMNVKMGYFISSTIVVFHEEGAIWKLFDENDKKIGIFDKDGRCLRK